MILVNNINYLKLILEYYFCDISRYKNKGISINSNWIHVHLSFDVSLIMFVKCILFILNWLKITAVYLARISATLLL